MLTRYDEMLCHQVVSTFDHPATSAREWTEKKIRSGELNRVEAFMGGLIQVEGDMTLLMQLEDTLNRFAGPPPQG